MIGLISSNWSLDGRGFPGGEIIFSFPYLGLVLISVLLWTDSWPWMYFAISFFLPSFSCVSLMVTTSWLKPATSPFSVVFLWRFSPLSLLMSPLSVIVLVTTVKFTSLFFTETMRSCVGSLNTSTFLLLLCTSRFFFWAFFSSSCLAWGFSLT